jgi:hypothetical protein
MMLFMLGTILYSKEIIRKLFLTKEIVSKEGVVHFRRYRLLSTPWFNIYIHNILHSDEDRDPHDHPWHFISIILWGSYKEYWMPANDNYMYWMGRSLRAVTHKIGSVIIHNAKDFHQIKLVSPSVWTLVFTWGKRPSWGFQTRDRRWVDFKEYRQLKNEGKL